ncbi:hypothetical protein QUF75_15095 [Desulfococcaceae bacterium HSG7]|nr:hypothetical protein [Desulfococcaceae bacterium HSG7]
MEKNQKAVLGVHPDEDNSSFVNILIITNKRARSAVVNLGLHNYYCHTVLAHSILKGFECLAAMPEIQIVIFENTIPSSRGLEKLVRKVKAHPQWKCIPVIMILAKPDPEIAQKSIELGYRHVMIKPLKAKQLLDKIDLVLLENSSKMRYNRQIGEKGAIFQQLYHQVAKLAVRAYKHVNRRLENKTMIASINERSQLIKGFLYRKKKRSYTTVAEWLSKELRIIRRIKPRMKTRHRIVTLGEWLSDEIRMMHRRVSYHKFAKKEEVKTTKPPQIAPLINPVEPADAPQPHDSTPAQSDFPINIQYVILFQKAPYLFSKGMQKQIENTISKD